MESPSGANVTQTYSDAAGPAIRMFVGAAIFLTQTLSPSASDVTSATYLPSGEMAACVIFA